MRGEKNILKNVGRGKGGGTAESFDERPGDRVGGRWGIGFLFDKFIATNEIEYMFCNSILESLPLIQLD